MLTFKLGHQVHDKSHILGIAGLALGEQVAFVFILVILERVAAERECSV
jgi:hypothetical protein